MFEEFTSVGYVLKYPKKRYRRLDNGKIISEKIPVEEMPERGIHPDE